MIDRPTDAEPKVTTVRARSDGAKSDRAGAILAAAQQLFATRSFADVTMAEIARQVGLAKGTLFLYFPTKEALGLSLVEQLLHRWFDALDGGLDALDRPASPEDVGELVLSALRSAPDLVPLLAIMGSVLEHNVSLEQVRRFKAGLLERMARSGARLEAALPWLELGAGGRVLLILHALVVGLHQLAAPAPLVREALASAPLSALRVDFERELAEAFVLHLRGLHSRKRAAPQNGPPGRGGRKGSNRDDGR